MLAASVIPAVSHAQNPVTVSVRDADGGMPGSHLWHGDAWIEFYRTTPTVEAIGWQVPDVNWSATWSDLVEGTYRAAVYNVDPDFGMVEYWGLSGEAVVEGALGVLEARRTEPVIIGYVVKDEAGMAIVRGTEVPDGTSLFVELEVRNSASDVRTCDLRIWGHNSDTLIEGVIGESSGVVLPADSTTTHQIEFTNLGSFDLGPIHLAPRIYSYGMEYASGPSSDDFSDVWGFDLNEDFIVTLGSRVLNVPFYSQRDSLWCSYTSLSMMLRYYGFSRKPWEIAADFNSDRGTGLPPEDAEDLLDNYLNTYYSAGSTLPVWQVETDYLPDNSFLDMIRNLIDSGHPLWLGMFGSGPNHAVLVVGYDADGIYLHNSSNAVFPAAGSDGLYVYVANQDFLDEVTSLFSFRVYAHVIGDRLSENGGGAPHGITSVQNGPAVMLDPTIVFDAFMEFENKLNPADDLRNLILEWDGSDPLPGYRFIPDGGSTGWYSENEPTLADTMKNHPIIYNSSWPLVSVPVRLTLKIRELTSGDLAETQILFEGKVDGRSNPWAIGYFPRFEMRMLLPGSYVFDYVLEESLDQGATYVESDRFRIETSVHLADYPYAGLKVTPLSPINIEVPHGGIAKWTVQIENAGELADEYKLVHEAGGHFQQDQTGVTTVGPVTPGEVNAVVVEYHYQLTQSVGEFYTPNYSITSDRDITKFVRNSDLPLTFEVVATSCVPPSIGTQPLDQTIPMGSSATLRVFDWATEPITRGWYVGQTGDTSNPIVGATESTYSTPALGESTSFWVRISNLCGSLDSDTATVTVETTSFHSLTIIKPGTGAGLVKSNPSGISCGTECSSAFGAGTTVTLTADPEQGSEFEGWSGGGCSGIDVCTVALNSDVLVYAQFELTGTSTNVFLDGFETGDCSQWTSVVGELP